MPTDRHSVRWQVYGLGNCDSCRLARKWLDAYEVPFDFHDIREEAPDQGSLRAWLESEQGSQLINRRSKTWRQLSDEQKAACEQDPLPLLMEHPTLIKRPLIAQGRSLLAVGYSPEALEELI